MDTLRLKPCIELPLEGEKLKEAVNKAKDWALMHGISMRAKSSYNKDQVQILSFTLLPSSFPRKNFERVRDIQTLLNELMHKVAHNDGFITDSLKSTIEVDPFTAQLFNVYQTVQKEGFGQTISLGLLRSDYMLHQSLGEKIKQVELNTIASSFGGIAPITTNYHKYILKELGHADKLKNIPENDTITGLCNGLIYAWNMYNNNKAVILFVVEDITYNICDQRFHEFEIRRLNSNIKVIRKSLTELVTEAQLSSNKELIVGGSTVAVVYFRSGYQVEAYPTDKEWSVRLMIERSKAIKCPSIQYHLAGTKKVQQSLAYPGVLNKFISDENKIKQIKEVFAGLYSLEFNDEGEAIIARAMLEPKQYVLKPQREGGGNNIYDEDIKISLQSMKDSDERKGWILMDRLYPPVQKNYIIRASPNLSDVDYSSYMSDVVSELGVYGVIIGDHKNIMYNEQVGHILRTKPSTENEGGIAAGVGALDSPYLVT